jgi:hypothetical protein
VPKQQEAFQTPRFELTRDELISITGCVKRPVRESKKQMLAWLAKEGIQFRINLQGWPVVSREHACERFGRSNLQVKPTLNMAAANNYGKTLQDCKEKFNNKLNFKSWPRDCKAEFSDTPVERAFDNMAEQARKQNY